MWPAGQAMPRSALKDEIKRAGTFTKFKKSIARWDGKACHFANKN